LNSNYILGRKRRNPFALHGINRAWWRNIIILRLSAILRTERMGVVRIYLRRRGGIRHVIVGRKRSDRSVFCLSVTCRVWWNIIIVRLSAIPGTKRMEVVGILLGR